MNIHQWLTTICWWPVAAFQSAFTCGHHNTPVHEGKCYCPDCGSGVIYRWLSLRCAGCNTKRDIRYVFRRWLPQELYCVSCGEVDVVQYFLDSPKYHQLHKARLVAISVNEFEQGQFSRIVASIFSGEARSKALLLPCRVTVSAS